MAPRVFFSFHYARDIWRVNQVRNSWVTHGGTTQKFLDASLWEETKRRGPTAIQALIDNGLQQSNATAVLIGNETAEREWVRYEIKQSWARNNRIIGIRINRLRDQSGRRDPQGANPFARVRYDGNKTLGQVIPIYDWDEDSGYENLAEWIEHAPRRTDLEDEGVTVGRVTAGAAVFGLGVLLWRMLRRRPPP